MGTDWSKVIEVFGSGIIGVFLVMILLQFLTQLSTRVIDLIETRNNGEDAEPDA
ncbi:MAG: hypothetical protein KAU27_10095 [Desulfuromonadales bacterium]|nr:hypothetical protein [Desulfuromonadales bacterium]